VLPEGFTERYVELTDVRLHVVTGGEGPPVLLIPGWPQTWYGWRLVMPELARHRQVVAVDTRGVGLSSKPRTGYDTGTLARDLVELMDALGHERFAVVGHDIGMWIGYALAADHPERIERLAVAEAAVPGLTPSPGLFESPQLWHFGFNRLPELNEVLVRGREEEFFGYQLRSKATQPLPEQAIQVYVDALKNPDALRASFEFYRALDTTIEQNARRKQTRLTLPVLTIAGAKSLNDAVERTMRLAADDVRAMVLPACGHYPAEEQPEVMVKTLIDFLASSYGSKR
jgi:pimeloyl-ACP methyl ester carboxylesterase